MSTWNINLINATRAETNGIEATTPLFSIRRHRDTRHTACVSRQNHHQLIITRITAANIIIIINTTSMYINSSVKISHKLHTIFHSNNHTNCLVLEMSAWNYKSSTSKPFIFLQCCFLYILKTEHVISITTHIYYSAAVKFITNVFLCFRINIDFIYTSNIFKRLTLL